MEQYQVVRIGQQEFFINGSGVWYLRMPSGLGAAAIPRVAFGLPQDHDFPQPSMTRGTQPHHRMVQDQKAPDQEEIKLQELGKPKKDFLKDVAHVLDSVGNVIGNFNKQPRQTTNYPQPMQRTVVLPANQNSKSGMFDNFSMTQKVALGGAALLLVGLVVSQAQKK